MGVQHRHGRQPVHFADDLVLGVGGVDDDEVFAARAAQRDVFRREVLAHPVPLARRRSARSAPPAGTRGFPAVPAASMPNASPSVKGSSKAAHLMWLTRIIRLSGLMRRVLRRPPEEVVGVLDDVLVQGRAGRDQHRRRRPLPPAGPARLLPRAGDGARIARHDARFQLAHVDAQLQRVGADDAQHVAAAQAPLDGPPLARASSRRGSPGCPRPACVVTPRAPLAMSSFKYVTSTSVASRERAKTMVWMPWRRNRPAMRRAGLQHRFPQAVPGDDGRVVKDEVLLALGRAVVVDELAPAARSAARPAPSGWRWWRWSTKTGAGCRKTRKCAAAAAARWPSGSRTRPGTCAARR